jgi:hypothetical protein
LIAWEARVRSVLSRQQQDNKKVLIEEKLIMSQILRDDYFNAQENAQRREEALTYHSKCILCSATLQFKSSEECDYLTKCNNCGLKSWPPATLPTAFVNEFPQTEEDKSKVILPPRKKQCRVNKPKCRVPPSGSVKKPTRFQAMPFPPTLKRKRDDDDDEGLGINEAPSMMIEKAQVARFLYLLPKDNGMRCGFHMNCTNPLEISGIEPECYYCIRWRLVNGKETEGDLAFIGLDSLPNFDIHSQEDDY